MNVRYTFLLFAVLCPVTGHGQAAPAASAPLSTSGLNFGLVNGTFRYGASLSEVFQTGYGQNGGVSEQTNLSGSLIYSTKSLKTPTSVIYSGGVLFSNQRGYGTNTFQSLALSQGYLTKNWTFGLSDIVSYLPQSPTTGLSGIPGSGDIGLVPVTGIDVPSQNILTYNSNRVSNTVTGNAARHLTAHTSISGDANYGLLHYFNGSALDTRQISGDLGLNYEISPRTAVGVGANYSVFTFQNSYLGSFAGGDSSFTTRSLNANAEHQFTRALSGSVSVGPQWVNSSSTLGIPSRLSASGSAAVTYARRFGTAAGFYSRGANGGSGVLPGAFSDSIGGSFSRSFGSDWGASANAGYAHTSGLGSRSSVTSVTFPLIGNYGGFNSTFIGVQATRRLSKAFSAFASYTASKQTYGSVAGVPGAINGLVQSFAIGISYYPRSANLGQF